jgi:hypothetical protein
LTAASSYSNGQIPKLHDIPDTFSTSPRYSELTNAHDVLATRRAKLIAAAGNLRSKCDQVIKGSPLATECAREQAAVEQERQKYSVDVNDFNSLLGAAIIAQRSIPFVVAGQVANSKGDWFLITADGRKLTSETLTDKSPIGAGSRIVTGPNSGLQVLLLDQTVFTLGPEGEFTIDDFVFDPAPRTASKLTVSLAKGFFRWVTGRVSRARLHNMRLNLAVGAIGIRGTDFVAAIEPDNSGYIKLFFGELEITPKRSKLAFVIQTRRLVRFSADGIFGQPEPFK